MSGGDIWSMNGISFANSINEVLEKEGVTIEEVLGEDELLQEIKAKNDSLIEFLTREENIIKMIDFIVQKAPECSNDLRKFRYPYMSCQVFCCEIPELLQIFQEDSDNILLNRLFSILDSPSPLDPYLAGYFEKTLGVLFRRLTITLMSYINKDGLSLLVSFIKHIDNYSIMQVIQRLMLPHIPFSVHGQEGDAAEADGGGEENRPDADLSPEELILTHCHWSYFEKTPSLLLDKMLSGRGKPESDVVVATTEGTATEITTDESKAGDPSASMDSMEFDIPAHIADLLITVLQLSPAESPLLINICDVNCLESLLEAALLNSTPIIGADGNTENVSPLWVLTDDTQCVSVSALTVFESIISRLSEALVLLSNIHNNDASMSQEANDSMSSENAEEKQHLLQQAAEVGLLINLNIEHVCIAVKPFVSKLAEQLKLYVDGPVGVLQLQSKLHQKCLGHRGLQLVKLVETIFRLVLCDVVVSESNGDMKDDSPRVVEVDNSDDGQILESSTQTRASETPSTYSSVNANAVAVKLLMFEMIPLLLETGILKYCWEMCFIYNNVSLLHLSVHRILTMMLDSSNPEIRILTQKHLFLDTDFMLQLIAALEARAAPPSKPPVESDAEEDVDPEVAPGEGKGETPDDSSKSGSVKKKPVYSYGAKPFIPFAGHLIQLAKIIEANLCSERDQHVSANAVENQTDSLEHVSKTLDEMALNKSADSEPTSGLNTDSIPPLQCILSQRVVHHRARDMTLLACWNEFVMDYGHYFVDDEAPVIVLPPSMGGTSDNDVHSQYSVPDAHTLNPAEHFMFFNTNISPPAVNVEPDDDEYVTNNQYLTSYEEDEDEADAFYDQVNRKYWDDSSSDEEEDMNEDDGFGKHTHTLGEYDSEENNAFGYPAIGSSSMNSKYYTASSPDDFHEQPSPPGASFAEDFNPFGFASTNESFSSPEASTNDSFEEPTDFSAAFANFGHPSPDVDNSVKNETVDPFGATSSSDPFDSFDPFADAPAASTGTTSEPVDESSPADASDPFATAEPVEDPFA